MKIFYGYKNLTGKLHRPIAAIGIFDGIHIGHKRVIEKVLHSASFKSDKVVITFDPHPETLLESPRAPLRIMSLKHRLCIFEKMGLDAVVVIQFTKHIAKMAPRDFVRHVLLQMGAKSVYVGSNFHFGHGKEGNVNVLKKISSSFGIHVVIVKPVKREGRIVSSTWLRELIAKGDIKRASRLLERPVSVLGTVVSGDKRGKVLGIPTANIDPHQEVIPPRGVYVVRVRLNGKIFNGVLNIGFRPTFYGTRLRRRKEPHIEVHIMDFKRNLYGRTIEVFFIKRLRNERHFKSLNLLKDQIKKDIERARKILGPSNGVYKPVFVC